MTATPANAKTAEVKFSVNREDLRDAIEEMVALQVRKVAVTVTKIRELIEAESEPHCGYGPGPECPVCTERSVLLNKFRTLLETFERRADAGGEVISDDRDASDEAGPGVVTTPDP